MYSTVYELVFPDGSRYVGKTKKIDQRVDSHRRKPANTLVENKWDEFGKESFQVNLIEKDIHDAVAYFIERHEISITPDKKCLNKVCRNKIGVKDAEPEDYKQFFLKEHKKRVDRILEAISVLKTDLPLLNPLYKEDVFSKKQEVIENTNKLMKYLNLTVNLEKK